MLTRFSFLLGGALALLVISFLAHDAFTPFPLPPIATPHVLRQRTLPISSLHAPSSTAQTLPTFTGAMVTLTFDDGFRSTYEQAIPILNNAGFKSTQYIITHKFDDPKYMNKEQVKELYRQGHEIGAHTQTHPNLTGLPLEKARQEIFGSKQDLENLGIKVTTLAYPVGKYNEQIIALVKNAGFIAARSTHAGYNTKNTNPYELVRYQVQWNTTLAQVKHWIDSAIAQKTWLILLFHRTDEDGEPTSSRHELLQQIVDYLIQQKISVVTLKEGVDLLF